MHGLVKQYQIHKCNNYCTKSYLKNGIFFKKCSFGFPRPLKTNTQLNDAIDCLAVSKAKQPRKRLYHIKRSPDEQFINDYNPALLLANQANINVQYLGSFSSRVPEYVVDYIMKSERS